jgi:hypothetical protein
VEHQEVLTEYPWGDEDSLDGLDEAAIGYLAEDDNNPSGAPNNQAGIYSESAKNAALKFGSALPPNSITKLSYYKFSVMPMPCIIQW